MSSLFKSRRVRATTAAFASSALAFLGAASLLGPQTGTASSHREAPQILSDPQADNTDTYAFVSPDKPDTVTLVANWLPLEEPAGGPNFYPFADDAHYNIKIDNNGDAKEDITYEWDFDSSYESEDTFLYNTGPVTSLSDHTLNFKQTYTLTRIKGGKSKVLAENVPVAPSNVGAASMPDYAALRDQAIRPTSVAGESTFAGQADDPFFLDLRVFDLLYGADLSETGTDTLSGYNVNSIALQTPISNLTGGQGDPVIGVWSTTDRPSIKVQAADGTQKYKGKFVQVSRLGNPLVNEVVIPIGLKDAFNALAPENDASVAPAVDSVNDPEVPKLIEAIYGIPAPKTPRDDLFAVFLTGVKGLNMPQGKVQPAEVLRLNTSIPPAAEPNRLGVLAGDTQGFPNGRRLADDVVDIEIQALEGAVRTGKLVEALAAGDAVDANDLAFESTFPYVALPHSGSADAGAAAPTGPVAAGGGGMDQGAVAPNRRDLGPTAASPAQPDESVVSPLALVAAGLGLGFAGYGFVLVRRGRRNQVES